MLKPVVPVSVIVPNYNSGTYLSDCVKSINSGLWPAEILIIDDCSTDRSFELAEKLKDQYSNIRLIRLEVNGGATEARKVGIAEATQDFIACVDADDLLEPNALEEAYATITSSSSDICIWELWIFDEQSMRLHNANAKNFPKTGVEAVLLSLGEWRIHLYGMVRRCVFEKAYKGFSETMFMADELLTRLVFSHATQVVNCKKKYYFRSHPLSSTRILSARRLNSLRRHLWLLKFARRFPAAPMGEIARNAIWEGWYYWTQRKQIGVSVTLRELRVFLVGLYSFPALLPLLWRSPKHLGGLMFLTIAVWIPL
jgi:glycosyltransferase involved in cell wall biosynthesis